MFQSKELGLAQEAKSAHERRDASKEELLRFGLSEEWIELLRAWCFSPTPLWLRVKADKILVLACSSQRKLVTFNQNYKFQ